MDGGGASERDSLWRTRGRAAAAAGEGRAVDCSSPRTSPAPPPTHPHPLHGVKAAWPSGSASGAPPARLSWPAAGPPTTRAEATVKALGATMVLLPTGDVKVLYSLQGACADRRGPPARTYEPLQGVCAPTTRPPPAASTHAQTSAWRAHGPAPRPGPRAPGERRHTHPRRPRPRRHHPPPLRPPTATPPGARWSRSAARGAPPLRACWGPGLPQTPPAPAIPPAPPQLLGLSGAPAQGG
jgi:hypothetical protein